MSVFGKFKFKWFCYRVSRDMEDYELQEFDDEDIEVLIEILLEYFY